MNPSIAALNALNFFMADVRDGVGPFLGVFLQSRAWSPAAIGWVMAIGSLAGILFTVPLGMLVDRVRAKRALMAVAALSTVVASLAILVFPGFAATAIAQSVSGVAGALVTPLIAGITLGLVRQEGYGTQIGRNEAFNHAGNVVAAVMAGVFGYLFGIAAVFAVMAAMALASLVAVSMIDPAAIDHRAARGLADGADGSGVSAWSALLRCPPLLLLASTLALFHLGNAAMLPLLGQALVARGAGDASAYTGATIVIAQLTMVPMALLAARMARSRGYWLVFVLALAALPVRGAIAAFVDGPTGLVPVQILDGVGAGLLGVAVPGLVERILSGTGHVNAGLGAAMTMQGIGAALSPALAGVIAEAWGYAAAFAALGAIAAAALVLWGAACCGRVAARRRLSDNVRCAFRAWSALQ